MTTVVSSTPTGEPRAKRIPVTTLVIVVIFCGFWVVQGALVYFKARHHDFLSFYTGSTLVRQASIEDLYDPELQFRTQQELVPTNSELIPFIRPAYYALLLAPLSLLPFGTAFWAWLGLQAVVLFLCWRWAARKFGSDALILGAMYFPAAVGITHAQDSSFMLAIAIGAYALEERGRSFWSGAVLGLGLIKFHLFVLVPLAMLFHKRYRMLSGFLAAGLLAGLSFLGTAGWKGVTGYAALLSSGELKWLSPAPQLMINLRGVTSNIAGNSTLLWVVLVGFVVGLVVIAIRGAPFWRWLSAAITGSVLVAPHGYAYDAAVLLLPIWMLLFVSPSRLSRVSALLLATPLPFFTLMAGPPWSILPALLVILLLCVLARESYAERQAAAVSPSP